MLVKIHSRGVGRGSGPVGYLLGQNRDRADARLLRGDPDTTEQLIDGNDFAQRYTSGVLSFAEADLSDDQKAQIMDSFERVLLPGLDADQRDVLWVEHTDKGRLELNFVVPNVELTSGKRLAPYFDKADRPRVNAFQQVVNDTFQLADPHDPERHRFLCTPNDLPRVKKEAAEAITRGLLTLASTGEVKDRQGVLRALEGAGFTVTRETKQSISIADPEGGKPIRLKGAIYERDFRLGPELRAEVEAAGRRYREARAERLEAARKTLADGIRAKREYNRARYPRPEPEAVQARPERVALDRCHVVPGQRSEHPGAVVDRQPHQVELGRDPAPENSAGGSRQQRRADSSEPVRAESMRSSGPDTAIQRQRWPHVHDREVKHDGVGAGIVERVRGAVGRVREVAERIRSGYRGLVEASAGLDRAGQRLEQSADQFNRGVGGANHTIEGLIQARERAAEISRQQSRGHDRGMSL